MLCRERNCAVGRYFLHTPVHIYGIVSDINFFLSVIFVSLALLLSTWVNNRFLITLFPFLLNYFSYMMLSFIKKAKYSPIIIMDMTRINALRFGPVVLECVCLTVLFGGVYFWRQKKMKGLLDERVFKSQIRGAFLRLR